MTSFSRYLREVGVGYVTELRYKGNQLTLPKRIFYSGVLYLDPVNGSEWKLGHNPSLKDGVEHGEKSSEGKTWKIIEELI